jgi:hypothetical protein
MPHENCAQTQEKNTEPGYSLHRAGWIAQLQIINLVLAAAVTGVLAVLLQALWERMHHTTKPGAGSHTGSRLPRGRGLRH